jgi:hypothetical protein
LDRWRKDLRREYTKVKVSYGDLNLTTEMCRFDTILEKANEVAELGSSSDLEMQLVLDCMDEMIKTLHSNQLAKAHEDTTAAPCQSPSCTPTYATGTDGTVEAIAVHSPFAMRGKRRPPKKRLVSRVDCIINNKKKERKQKQANSKHVRMLLLVCLNVFNCNCSLGMICCCSFASEHNKKTR